MASYFEYLWSYYKFQSTSNISLTISWQWLHPIVFYSANDYFCNLFAPKSLKLSSFFF